MFCELVFAFPPFGVVVSFEVGGIFKGGVRSSILFVFGVFSFQ